MTDAEHGLVVAACARSAELWALGHEHPAERWFSAAIEMLGTGEFADADDEQVDR